MKQYVIQRVHNHNPRRESGSLQQQIAVTSPKMFSYPPLSRFSAKQNNCSLARAVNLIYLSQHYL